MDLLSGPPVDNLNIKPRLNGNTSSHFIFLTPSVSDCGRRFHVCEERNRRLRSLLCATCKVWIPLINCGVTMKERVHHGVLGVSSSQLQDESPSESKCIHCCTWDEHKDVAACEWCNRERWRIRGGGGWEFAANREMPAWQWACETYHQYCAHDHWPDNYPTKCQTSEAGERKKKKPCIWPTKASIYQKAKWDSSCVCARRDSRY